MEHGSRLHSIKYLEEKIQKTEQQLEDLNGLLTYLKETKIDLDVNEPAERAIWHLLTGLKAY